MALGGALVLAGLPKRRNLVSPGPLTSHHSAIDKGCAACHAIGEGTLADWVHASVVSAPGADQSELCLDCHRQYRQHGLNPHSQDPQVLAAITQRVSSAEPSGTAPFLLSVARFAMGAPADANHALACAACHNEHRGSDASLTAMTDMQCQVCHDRPFRSFSQGHPEFGHYPYLRRTLLYFDHVSHYGSHFTDPRLSASQKDRVPGCRECHVQDPAGQAMVVRGFDTVCAICHREQIEDDTSPGVPFLALPILDLKTLDATRIGQWPAVFDKHLLAAADVPPLMRLLLRADPEFAEAESQLAGVDLSDLSQASERQKQAAESYVWSIKKLIYEAVTDGQAPLRQRFVLALGSKAAKTELDDIVGQVPLPAFAAAQQRWLPDLKSEFEAHQDGRQLSLPRAAPKGDAETPKDAAPARESVLAGDRSVTSGWYLRDVDLSLRYRPVGHADRFLRAWLDAGARVGQSSSADAAPGSSPGTSLTAALKGVFHSLARPSAVGRCMKCHTADSDAAGGTTIRWLSRQPALEDRNFTKFSHRPHITPPGNDGCLPCHSLKEASDSAASWSLFRPVFLGADGSLNTNPHGLDGNFAPLSKAQCASCHAPGAARDGCLTCHNYHILSGRRGTSPRP
ncbi:MAG: hypothetical protein HYS13_15885 [Planctomycetia bacterium]|nr:hypothetical protein [Planctomycetia bacterium]